MMPARIWYIVVYHYFHRDCYEHLEFLLKRNDFSKTNGNRTSLGVEKTSKGKKKRKSFCGAILKHKSTLLSLSLSLINPPNSNNNNKGQR